MNLLCLISMIPSANVENMNVQKHKDVKLLYLFNTQRAHYLCFTVSSVFCLGVENTE